MVCFLGTCRLVLTYRTNFLQNTATTHLIFVYVLTSITSHLQNEAPPVGWWRCFLLRPLYGGLVFYIAR